MSQRGRKSKLNSTVASAIIENLRAGQTRRNPALAAGIAESTFHAWLTAGREKPQSDFGALVAAIDQVEIDRRNAIAPPPRRTPLSSIVTTTTRQVETRKIRKNAAGIPVHDSNGDPLIEIVITEITTTAEKFNTAAALRWLRRHLNHQPQFFGDLCPETPEIPHLASRFPEPRESSRGHVTSLTFLQVPPSATSRSNKRPEVQFQSRNSKHNLKNTYFPSKNSGNPVRPFPFSHSTPIVSCPTPVCLPHLYARPPTALYAGANSRDPATTFTLQGTIALQ